MEKTPERNRSASENGSRKLSYYEESFKRANRIQRFMHIVVFVSMISIGVTVFFGLRQIFGESGSHSVLVPLVVAIATALVMGFGWHSLYSTTPIANEQGAQIGVAFGFLCIGIAFSAWPMATIIGGTSAVTAHLNSLLSEARTAFQITERQMNSQIIVISRVESESQTVANEANREASFGTASGQAGQGAVSSTFGAIADNLRNAAKDMRVIADKAITRRDSANNRLLEMQRLVADTSLPHAIRQERFANLAAGFADDINAINNLDFTIPLLNVSRLPALKQMNANSGAAIASMRSNIEEFAGKAREEIKRIKTSYTVLLPSFSPIGPGDAVLRYSGDIVPSWSVALGLDALPILMLFLLIAVWRDVRTKHDNSVTGAFGLRERAHHEAPPDIYLNNLIRSEMDSLHPTGPKYVNGGDIDPGAAPANRQITPPGTGD